jgi:hypothetical protein
MGGKFGGWIAEYRSQIRSEKDHISNGERDKLDAETKGFLVN